MKTEQMSNWELSIARAGSARRDLEQSGINPSRIARVVGFADKVPLLEELPHDARNRRVSIVFLKNKRLKPPDKLDWLIKPPG